MDDDVGEGVVLLRECIATIATETNDAVVGGRGIVDEEVGKEVEEGSAT